MLNTFIFSTVIATLLNTSNPLLPERHSAVKEACACTNTPKDPKLFRCNSKTKANEVRCMLTRKSKVKGKTSETSYVFVALKQSDKKRDLKINGTVKNQSALMYSGDIFTIDNRSSSKEYTVKIHLWDNKGYKLELRRDDYLKITFKTDSPDPLIEPAGAMVGLFDSNHTLTSTYVKQDIFSRPFTDPDEMVGMAIAYFIFEYNKALVAK